MHQLSAAEADRRYPVHLDRAQITFYEPEYGLVFLRDSSDGIFAHVFPPPDFHPHAGDMVSVDAVSGPGKFTSVLVYARLHLLGRAPLANPALVGFDRILSGALDSEWVGVRGIVRSVRPVWDDDLAITLASGPDRLEVITPRPGIGVRSDLIDAEVRIRASVGANFNERNQFVGIFLFMPDLSCLQVEEPATDPFSRPPRHIEDVMRPGSEGPGHRVHVRGVVTSIWGDRHFSLMGPEHGLYVTTEGPESLNVGSVVDVAGFPSIGDYTAVLEDSVVRPVGSATPPGPVLLTAQEALKGLHDAESIEVDGRLVEPLHDRSGSPSLLLNASGVSYVALLPPGSAQNALSQLEPGSRLRVRGICLIHAADDKTPVELTVLLRSPADIVVLSRPSWWTGRHALVVVALLGAVVLLVGLSNLVLRRQVRRHTQTIRLQLQEAETLRRQAEAAHQEKSESLSRVLALQQDLLDAQEKLRYQATHDALTGLWNRRALFDLLEKEIERCLRTQGSLGILLLDIDHFKPVNDSLGHLAGDQVLREIAVRISHAIRSYDLAGRYGGEEFLVLLPGCDREQTEAGAERIRYAISYVPMQVAGSAVDLTVSIGATVAPQSACTATEVLSLADVALYQAKRAGRNRTIVRLSFAEERAEA